MDEYIKQNSDKRIFISIACGPVWNNWNDYDSSPTANQYRKILDNYNAFVAAAVEDKSK